MLLEARNISKTIQSKTILKDINLSFSRGEIVGLLGPNGAGKTTMFFILAGMDFPTTGDIFLCGQNITTHRVCQRANSGLVYLPQEPSVFRGLSVEDNIKAVLQINRYATEAIQSRTEECLEEFSLHHLRKSLAAVLSGGERRRLEIARALAAQPVFLMLDEPFSGVDPISISNIVEIIKKLKESNIGIILTDHNVRETLQVIDHGYVIANGTILASGSPAQITANDQVQRQYLGSSFQLR